MALLFRINVISKKLSSLCCLRTKSFDKKVVLAPFACRQRNLFTNSCSIYFSKKKVDEVKTPKCPDFEQFFTKTKKVENNKNGEVQLSKGSDEKRKPPFSQPPIFDDKIQVKPPPRLVPEKRLSSQTSNTEDKPPPNVPTKNETKLPDDKAKQTDKSQISERKYSPIKPLDEFKQFAVMPRFWGTKITTVESIQTQQKEIVAPEQSQIIEDRKNKEKISETSKHPTDEENSRSTRKYLWLAAAAAIFGTTLVCFHPS